MYNHLRTLLMNTGGNQSTTTAYPGEELVPSSFTALALPAHIAVIRSTIFGVSPDRTMLNFRLRQLLPFVHTKEYEPFVLNLDSRVTYTPFDNYFYTELPKLATVSKVTGTSDLYFRGSKTKSDNVLYYQYMITVLSPTSVKIERLSLPTTTVTATYTTSSGLSDFISLPDSNLSFAFRPVTNDQWYVTLLTEPTRSLIDVFNDLETNSSNEIDQLFITPSTNTLMLNLYAVWKNRRRSMPDRLAVLVLALGYRLEEIRAS